jgi:glycosyltransferase involved in cell wall biosynthesis
MSNYSICFLVHDIHLGGGGERVAINLANTFLQQENKVTIVSIAAPNTHKPINGLHQQVEVAYLTLQSKSALLNKIISVNRLSSFLKENSFDFVLGIGSHPTLILSLVPSQKDLFKIGCIHGSYNALPSIWKLCANVFYRNTDALISLTHFDKDILARIHHHVVVIPNGVSLPEVQSPLCNKTVLALGRLSPEKDFATMMELFDSFCKINADWNLRIRGDGPLGEELRKQVLRCKLSDRIEILPPTKDVESEYLRASIVLLTSKNEGLPMVLIEAQSYGIPVISFDCETGPAEIIQDGITGYLIDLNQKQEFVTRLLELTSNIVLRKEMGKQAKINSERFSEDSIVKEWLNLFQELKQNKK